MNCKQGMLVVLSAPSGCGKDTVFKELKKIRTDCVESISATTRSAREGEVDGVNYYFKSTEEFEDLIKNGGLLEYVQYNNCYYGTPVEGVKKAIADGKVCFLIIEVKGARKILELFPDCVSIFLLPPSNEVLEHRLKKRGTDSSDVISNRLKIAESEIKEAKKYKYNVVNDALEDAVEEINNIINNELIARNK